MEREQRVAQHTKYRGAVNAGACRPRAQSRASDIKLEKMRNPLSEATRSLRLT